jgi:hypothetical protein
MNKMIPWLQNERDEHFSNECPRTLQPLESHEIAAARSSQKDQWIHELVIKHRGLWKLLPVIRIAGEIQLVIVEQDSLHIENREIHLIVGFISNNNGNFSDGISTVSHRFLERSVSRKSRPWYVLYPQGALECSGKCERRLRQQEYSIDAKRANHQEYWIWTDLKRLHWEMKHRYVAGRIVSCASKEIESWALIGLIQWCDWTTVYPSEQTLKP